MTFRPLLAATIPSNEALATLTYPMIASPKLDGIRVLIHPTLGPITRKLKPIPNVPTNIYLHNPDFHFLDGEIMVGDTFSDVTSAIMSHDGAPEFTYYIFDSFEFPNKSYTERISTLSNNDRIKVLEHIVVNSIEEVLEVESRYLLEGYEGLMLRKPSGRYKFNRSTLNEQILLKLKRFKDGEAKVIGFEELYRNDNKKENNNLGYSERSSSLDGLVAMDTLGSLIVQSEDFDLTFKVGSGYDEATRKDIWNRRDEVLEKTIKVKYQDIGMKDRPRFPIFLGFRED